MKLSIHKLTLVLSIVIGGSSLSAMSPLSSFSNPSPEPKFFADRPSDESPAGIKYECPLCFHARKFPSFAWIMDRMQELTDEEKMSVYNQVYDYKGDLMPGKYCPFCEMEISKDK